MPMVTHYSRPPIVEAVLDIRVQLPTDSSLESLAALQEPIRHEYPASEPLFHFRAQMVTGPQVGASAIKTPIGHLFKSIDNRQVFQARMDGFTYSRLAPYESWTPFRDEANHLWQAYRSIANVQQIDRVALRTVNRFDLPVPIEDFKDYFRTFGDVSPDLPQGLIGYFMHLEIPERDSKTMLVINQAILPPVAPGVVSVLLDIDVSIGDELNADEEAIWQFLEKLHDRRNAAFEACITDRARELIR